VLQFSFMLMVVLGAFSVLGPVVADEELGGAKAWGAILTAWSAGLVTGGVIGLRFRPRRMLLAATLAILAFPLPLAALGFPLSVPAIAAAAFVAGVGNEIFGLLWHTTMQQEIPPDKLSRVYSYDALGSVGLVPLGYALAGPAAEAFGVRATLWGAAAISVAVTLAVLLVRDVRTLERRTTPIPSPATGDPENATA
jgi:MFS family permease